MIATTPRPTESLIPRPRLLRRLNDWQALRVVRITAPAGYGKSTLVSQWLQTLEADACHTTWLTMSEQDDREDIFLMHLATALAGALPVLHTPFAAERGGYIDQMQLTRAIFREIAADEQQRWILVLDDLHMVQRPGDFAFFRSLADDAPPNLLVVTISRHAQPLPLGRMLVDGSVLGLDMHDLRFDAQEFREFAQHSTLSALNERRLADIERSYQGWIAALRLLALTISASDDNGDIALRSSRGALDEYLETEAYLRLPAELRSLLLDTAFLPFVTPRIAAAVSGRDVETCDRLLHLAHAAHAFTTQYLLNDDEEETCYRYHPLLQQFLRRRLQLERGSDETRRIRTRTAAALAAAGDLDAAIDLLRDDVHSLTNLVAAHARPAILAGNLAAARRWIAAVPADALSASPQLAVDRALACYLADDPKLGAPVEIALRATAALAEDSALRREAIVLSALWHYLNGDSTAAQQQLHRIARSSAGQRDMAAGYAAFVRSITGFECPTTEDRVAAMAHAAEIFTAVGFDHGSVETTVLTGLLRRRALDIDGAIAALTHATTWITERGFEHHLYATDAHIALGEVLYFTGRNAQARAAFLDAQHTNARLGPLPVNSAFAAVGLQLCALDAGEPLDDAALADDVRLWTALRSEAWPVMIGHVGWLRILRDARRGDKARCWQTAESLPGFSPHPGDGMPETIRMAILSAAVLTERTIPALAQRLAEFRSHLAATGNHWMEIFVRALQVNHARQTRQDAEFRRLSSELFAETSRTGLTRIAHDIAGHTGDSTPAAPFDLSARELSVLTMLLDGRRTSEIEQALHISNATVRAHLRNIFRKLGVHSRVEAIKAARNAGISP